MDRVDFYVVPDPAPDAHVILACRLAEKAFRAGHTVYLHASSATEATALDELLWTFRAGSFLPHARSGDEHATECPIVIGTPETPPVEGDVLINLSGSIPGFYRQFARVTEPVSHHPEIRKQARARFRDYREQGCALHSHDLAQ